MSAHAAIQSSLLQMSICVMCETADTKDTKDALLCFDNMTAACCPASVVQLQRAVLAMLQLALIAKPGMLLT